jgi:regulation of enolase protein 1 (concanavalin A-like superfamily)
MNWFNEPASCSRDGEQLTIRTAPGTDFWRKTHYGFIRDNGHFLPHQVEGDFIAEADFDGAYRDLYDQAGLMVRENERTWVKAGIEFVAGMRNASVVVTRDYSDWSVLPLERSAEQFSLRIEREGGALSVFYSETGQNFRLLRIAFLTETRNLQVGPMAASPEGSGFDVTFGRFVVRPR